MTAPTLRGPRVTLRPPVDTDAEQRRRHGWHREIERAYGHDRDTGPMSAEEADAWLARLRTADPDTCWVIELSGEAVGVTFLHSLSTADRQARFAIGLFAPEFLGRGLGREVTTLVLGHAFDTLGLHRVDLRVLAFNTPAIACYERCGFVVEGRERDSCRMENGWHDDLIMGVLATDPRAEPEGHTD